MQKLSITSLKAIEILIAYPVYRCTLVLLITSLKVISFNDNDRNYHWNTEMLKTILYTRSYFVFYMSGESQGNIWKRQDADMIIYFTLFHPFVFKFAILQTLQIGGKHSICSLSNFLPLKIFLFFRWCFISFPLFRCSLSSYLITLRTQSTSIRVTCLFHISA